MSAKTSHQPQSPTRVRGWVARPGHQHRPEGSAQGTCSGHLHRGAPGAASHRARDILSRVPLGVSTHWERLERLEDKGCPREPAPRIGFLLRGHPRVSVTEWMSE